MTTNFALLTLVCGLSHREAAKLFDVRIDTVKSWASGRRSAPQQVLRDLAQLAVRLDTEADSAAIKQIDPPAAIDDAEAQYMGWPCVGAQNAYAGRVIARTINKGD